MVAPEPDTPEWWRNEARMSAQDGHPYAALYAMARALVPECESTRPSDIKANHPAAWSELFRYAKALGVSEWLRNG